MLRPNSWCEEDVIEKNITKVFSKNNESFISYNEAVNLKFIQEIYPIPQ